VRQGKYFNSQMLERRKTRRKKMVLPVKVAMFGSTQFAHTLDITASGARLGSLRSELKPGEIIVLHRGAKKAKFRISWVQQLNPKEIQAGIEALEPQQNFWGVDLTAEEREEKKNVEMLMTLLSKD
jgi:hypothetical protein